MSWSKEDYLKKYIHFTVIPLKVWGIMKFAISDPLTLQMLHTKLGKDLPSSWEEINERRIKTHSN